MSIKSTLNEMLQLQASLNEMTNGLEWRNGHTRLGKKINWQRCIYMETAELIDSYPWKHWKSIDAQADVENARLELVDIWHFLMSLSLEQFSASFASELLESVYESNSRLEMTPPSIEQTLAVYEALMRIALQAPVNKEAALPHFKALAAAFFSACQVASLSFSELYKIYIAKNVLNQFRQDHGYKEGTYQKLWNGKEDNVVMFELLEGMADFSSEALYAALKSVYTNIA